MFADILEGLQIVNYHYTILVKDVHIIWGERSNRGSAVLHDLLMSGDVKEEIWILWGRIFRPMWTRVRHDHKNGPVRLALLSSSKKGQRIIGDQIWKIIPSIVPTVPDLVSIDIQGIIIKSWISDQTHPLIPTLWNVVTLVFIEVFAKVAWKKAKNTIIYHHSAW